MAKKRKSSQNDETQDVVDVDTTAPEDVVETAEVSVEEIPPEVEGVDLPEVEIEPTETVKDVTLELQEQLLEPIQNVPQSQDSASNSVLLPAILGGVIAAGLGFGAAYLLLPRFDPTMLETMNTNEAAIATLTAEVAAIDPSAGIAPLTDELGNLTTQVAEQYTALEGRIVTFEERLIALEKQPSGDGTLQEAALQAYQAELDTLRAQVEEQTSAAFAQLESTREEAAAIEEASLLAARNAKARAALAQIRSALDTGAPMTNALAELEDVLGAPAPDALTAVADGVPTLSKLQGDFPPAARQALADSRSGGTSGESTGAFGSFLREQLNVRSVAPREGDDADAILSRAEAALKEGQLEIALSEVAGLSEIAAAPLAGWVNQAQARAAALTAADSVSTSLNDN